MIGRDLGWRSTLFLFGLPGLLVGALLVGLLEENRGNNRQGGAIMQTALADVADKTSIDMLFGLYFTLGSAIGAPWALLLGMLVDGYGFPAAFAAMGGSQVLAALFVLPVRLRRGLQPVPAQ